MASTLSGRPLLDVATDRPLFVRTDDESKRLTAALERRLNVLILGAPGSGKTTLLRRLSADLAKRKKTNVYVDAALADSPAVFLQLVRDALGLTPTTFELTSKSLAAGLRPAAPVSRTADSVRALQPDGERATGEEIILVDSLDPEIAHSVFGRLRDEVWQLPYTWVIAGDLRHRVSYLTPPADAFFDVVVTIPDWPVEKLHEMLARRVSADDLSQADINRLAELAAGNPRRLLALARESIIDGRRPGSLVRERKERRGRAAEISPDAIALVETLEELGPVSASDQKLLDALQWPRERAARTLKELERAGLVSGASRRTEEGGRPRRVYELVSIGKP